MGSRWKRSVEWLLVRSGVATAARRNARPSIAVLAYHNVVPHGEPFAGDASLHVDQRDFARQLDVVLRTCDVVPLENALRRGQPGSNRSQVAITFDDAYRGALTAGVDELRSRGLPATVFVCPGLLGHQGFWWDRLAPQGGGPLEPRVRAHAIWRLQGRATRVLAWAAQEDVPVAALPDHALPADESILLERAAYEGISLAAHTWSHPNLAALPLEDTRHELAESTSWLRDHAPRYVDWLAYPYGLRTDETVTEAERQFEGATVIEGGLARKRGRWVTSPHSVPRINVPRGLSPDGLALRLAGVLR